MTRTSYETEPVADIAHGAAELIAAFNRLENALDGCEFSHALRQEFAKSVPVDNGMELSPYEIGIAAAAAPPGRYSANVEKLRHALQTRPAIVCTLFTCAAHGLLVRLLQLCTDFRAKNTPKDSAPNLYWEKVYPPLIRFMNECRRMQAFW
jgi:hypothetical protein